MTSFENRDDIEALGKHLKKIEARLFAVEKAIQAIQNRLEQKYCRAETVIIENLNTDKFEFAIRSIDIKELAGTLNVGMNYGKNLKKFSKIKDIEQSHEQSDEICKMSKRSVRGPSQKSGMEGDENKQRMRCDKRMATRLSFPVPKITITYKGQ